MKLASILLFVFVFTIIAKNVYSQDARVSINKENTVIQEILDEIENQTDYLFLYNKKSVNVNRQTTIKESNTPVARVLENLFDGTGVISDMVGNHIVLTSRSENKQEPREQQQGRVRITGTVTDEYGEPVAGANVVEKGVTNGVITDLDGKYVIHVSEGAVLLISYIGYVSQEVTVGNQRVINVTLDEDIRIMDEVVVIGYGTVKRANLTGAISTADAQTFRSRPVQNAANALQGEVPGLTVIRTSGAPGSSPVVRVRDVSSINGGSPLILIDGAEGDLNTVNSADIENVSVLKDGTAAIYGARAADGVILITTKNAKRNQKLKISFDAYYSIKKPALLRKPAGLYEHALMALEITDGSFPIEYTEDELQLILEGSDKVLPAGNWGRWSGYEKFYKNQNWNDLIIGNGSLQNYNVALSGGGEKYSYLISLGYQHEEGLPKFGKDSDERYFVRAKSNIEIVKNLQYDINLSYEASSRDYSSGISEGQNIWELIYKTRSWAPLRNPAGNFYTFEGFDNPAQLLEDGGFSNLTTGNFTINNQLSWQPLKDLNIIGRAVIRKSDKDKNVIRKMLYSYNWENVNHRTARTPNSAEWNYGKTLLKNFTLYADYKKSLGKHDIGVMAGIANESADYDYFSAKRINFDQQENMSLQLGSSENQTAYSEGNAWTINSFFSRLSYSFANKYMIDGVLRADGSSRFHPDHRWGYFPGISAAWHFNEEKFMKDLNIFDELKFKASYGEMGNQSGIGLYDYIQLVSISSSYYPFGNGQKAQMASPGNIVSISRTWETIESIDAGLEFAALKNRLFGSFDYFWKENTNMLIPVTYPSMLGADAPRTNSGSLEIKGWEIALGWRDRVGDLSYSIKGSLSDARNKVVERVGSNIITHGLNATPTGYPLSSWFGYVFDGIIQNEQELAEYEARFPNGGIPGHGDLSIGDAKYKDLDNDGKLTVLGDDPENGTGDVVYLGNTNPRYNFGLNLGAEYRGFDFSTFIQGVGDRTIFLEGDADKPFAQPWFQSAEYWFGKTWTEDRTDAKYPAITNKGKRSYNYYISSNTKHNVAYMRLKNLQVGYTIPEKYVRNLKMEKIRLYFSGEDLYEIHNAPGGWDPEDGGGFTGYPFARNFSFGVNVVF
ncbi:MAG: TonB-dependent receptor [Tannerella sp.]|jgi:TonB-linked SusC/RagA family outer membrane protein|nr:TonB-dependent receptor [Tannerella sp.]